MVMQELEEMKKSDNHYGDLAVEGEVIAGDGGGREEEDDDLVLPGFRFHPTDEELVTFYLRRKVAGKRLSIEIIKEMDIYKHDPWDFLKASTVGGDKDKDKEWYFFCLRGRKYRNSIRPNRVTGSGFWKATGIDRPIPSSSNSGDCIGLKKSLVYYRGSAGKGTKTEWMMHEFRLPPPSSSGDASSSPPPCLQEAEVWTICRIFKRNITYKKQPQRQPAAAASQPDSSSVTGGVSLEAESTATTTGGDTVEYVNGGYVPQAPSNVYSGYNPQLHGQWNNGGPAMGGAAPSFHGSVLSPSAAAAAASEMYYYDDIGRMVMELADDPSVFYNCTYA